MYLPSEKEAINLSKKGNLIPIYREIPGDLETPVSAYLKLAAESEYGYLLESVEGEEKIARFSFIGCAPSAILKLNGAQLEILSKDSSGKFKHRKEIIMGNPLSRLKEFMSVYKFIDVDGAPLFCGGLVGYLGYDLVRSFENIPDKNPAPCAMPDAFFLLSDTFVIFDHLKHSLKIIACAFLTDKNPKTIRAAYKKSIARIESIVKKLREPIANEQGGAGPKKALRVKALTAKKDFMRMVEKAKTYIRKGDIIQVVLSQIFSKPMRHKPFTIYRNLRNLNPSAYMFYLKFKDLYLIGSSPEMLVRCEKGMVTTRPIAGTRPRSASGLEDLRLENELLKDAKERAEHIMLVDLGRNDLGRVCEYGSVRLSEFMRIERYSHVMHIVSEIQGRLIKGKDIYDLLQAAFPAGTVSGSPKVRAMEIIDQLESFRRGPYAGAVGYFGFSGNLDTCITIRTIVIKKNIAYIQAGAGIVSGSKPEREYQEILNKAKAQLEAVK
ncbi:MAG: anthranilate synthase component I [Omnitrophica WOR_2 bacterium RIFCSPHIGHO2_02_FULL_45_21]|nr:MAG: anthranilate synthase component I [Omnitrophica WOR_2 bacterium RIFCSPHIGHO2_02_FULL_45_21]